MRIPEQREPEFIINNLDIFSQPEHESYTGIHLEIYIIFCYTCCKTSHIVLL